MSRDQFQYWWPVIARIVGVLAGLGQGAYATINSQPADTAFLGFCGALVIAPWVFPAEKRRSNGSNKVEESTEEKV